MKVGGGPQMFTAKISWIFFQAFKKIAKNEGLKRPGGNSRGLVEYLCTVSFKYVNSIVQNGDFCSISPFVLKYLPHPV